MRSNWSSPLRFSHRPWQAPFHANRPWRRPWLVRRRHAFKLLPTMPFSVGRARVQMESGAPASFSLLCSAPWTSRHRGCWNESQPESIPSNSEPAHRVSQGRSYRVCCICYSIPCVATMYRSKYTYFVKKKKRKQHRE